MSDFREYQAAFHAHNNDILHYGVKGMKWHEHKKRGPEEWFIDALGGQEEIDRLTEKGNNLQQLQADQHYGQLAEQYVKDPEARAMMKPYIREAVESEVQKQFGDEGLKTYNTIIKQLQKNHSKKEREKRQEQKKYKKQKDKMHSGTKKSSNTTLH